MENIRDSTTQPQGDGGEGTEDARVRAETARLMSVPTIDIKLELQMRGVDHRDAFEKVDLARRLAELRTSSSSPSSSSFVGIGQATETTAPDSATSGSGDDDGDDSSGGGRTGSQQDNPIPPEKDGHAQDKIRGGETTWMRGNKWDGGGGGEAGIALSATSKTASSSSSSPLESTPAPVPESAPRERKQTPEEGETWEDAIYARDVSKAESMGKKALTRELNAMGVAHSRLSDVSVLARQYASGRRGAREEAKEARRFRAERDLDDRLEVSRLLALGRADLEARLRESGIIFFAGATDCELASLLAREGGGVTGAPGGVMQGDSSGFSGKVAGDRGEGGQGRGGEGEGKGGSGERWTPMGQWGRATSRLPWNIGRNQNNDNDDDDDEVEDNETEGEETGVKEEEEERGERVVGGERTSGWGKAFRRKAGETSAAGQPPGNEMNDTDAGSSAGWSTRGNAGNDEGDAGSRSDQSTHDDAGSDGSPSSCGETGGAKGGKSIAGASGERRRKVSLRARAGRMSSRELMAALDDLGAHYRIPARRSELQQTFVLAALEDWNASLGLREDAEKRDGGDGGSTAGEAGGKKGQDRRDIVPISPYEEEVEETHRVEYPPQTGFETYHAALSWARQLSFDDVLEELRYREVRCNPKAGYIDLTRLLADEVLADEERMAAEERAGGSPWMS